MPSQGRKNCETPAFTLISRDIILVKSGRSMIDLGKTKYGVEDLRQIMAQLRAPDGCPWDRVQDHDGIRRYFSRGSVRKSAMLSTGGMIPTSVKNWEMCCCRWCFIAAIAESEGAFTFDDVCDGICR